MAAQNDGRIPGGPTTPAIIQQRESHISSLIFSGQLHDYDDIKLREHGDWRSGWELTSAQKDLVQSFGFHHVDRIRFLRHDRDLILSLIERWWPQCNTFHLPVGEMTITLADVAQIIGLPIVGDPIYYDDEISSDELIRTYLGVEPPPDLGSNYGVKLTWLRSTFMDTNLIGDTTDDSRVIYCTRAYLLCLCSSFLFPDGTGNKINVHLLPFLADLGVPTRHAWGAATLAYLYHCMTNFVKCTPGGKFPKSVCGCVTLIQIWSYEHFGIGRPVCQFAKEERVFPAACRWMSENVDQNHIAYRVASIYRGSFDAITYIDVQWQPCSVPNEILTTSRQESLHRYFIIHNGHIMFHPADRIMRQLGLKQMIPQEPLSFGHTRANTSVRVHSVLSGWTSRFVTHSVERMSQRMTGLEDSMGSNEYRVWYGFPRIQNRVYAFPEARFQHRTVDNYSLREMNACVNEVKLNLGHQPRTEASLSAMSGNELRDGVALKVETIINHSQKLEEDIKKVGLKVKNHEDNLEFLKSQIKSVDRCIHDTQVKLGTYHNPSVAVEENNNISLKNSEEQTVEHILALETSAAGIICQMKVRHGLQASKLPLTKDVLGVVATLGKVNDDKLSRAISEFLGLETMLAIVCKSYEGVKALEKYDSEGMIDRSSGLHGLGPSIGRLLDGRFLVFCLENLRPYIGEFIPEDPQKRLSLLKPMLPNGESPPGFLGFAVNMINVDRAHISCLTTGGHGLRETLFYNLFSRLQVYETRGQMQSALPCISDGAISLDGGIMRINGLFSLGDRNNVEVKFPVSSGISNTPTEVIEMEEEIKLMNWKKERLVEDMSREQALLNKVKNLFNMKSQELSKLLDSVKSAKTHLGQTAP